VSGETGNKHPLVCWLAVHLANLGFRPGVVTRGYGGFIAARRNWSKPPTIRTASAMKRLCWATQIAGADRPSAAIARRRPQLLINAGCDVIVSDDGLQALCAGARLRNYRRRRRTAFSAMDACLPAGPLREAAGAP